MYHESNTQVIDLLLKAFFLNSPLPTNVYYYFGTIVKLDSILLCNKYNFFLSKRMMVRMILIIKKEDVNQSIHSVVDDGIKCNRQTAPIFN